MKKSDLLKSIAEKAYDVGFGAKMHFSTLDIVKKVPGMIGFISISIGILALVYNNLTNDFTSAMLLISGVLTLYISRYTSQTEEYDEVGRQQTKMFSELKALYFHTKNLDDSESLDENSKKLSEIETRFYSISKGEQILFSNWLAHYKFFWEQQIDWIEKERSFGFFRDKVPLSLWFFVCFMFISIAFIMMGKPLCFA